MIFFYDMPQSHSGFMSYDSFFSLQFTYTEVLFSLVIDLPAQSTSVSDKDPHEVCVGVRNAIMIIFLST